LNANIAPAKKFPVDASFVKRIGQEAAAAANSPATICMKWGFALAGLKRRFR
jgi:hypothetical protein